MAGRVRLWVLSMKVTWSDAGAVIFFNFFTRLKTLAVSAGEMSGWVQPAKCPEDLQVCQISLHLFRMLFVNAFAQVVSKEDDVPCSLNICVEHLGEYARPYLCYLLAVCLDVSPLIACFRWSYLTTTEKVRIICAHHIHIPCARDIAGCYMFRNRLVPYIHVLYTIYRMFFRSSYGVGHTRIWCAYGESA